MNGLAAVDFGVATDSTIASNSLDSNTIKSLLLLTNLEHKKFLITENGKPIAAMVPAYEEKNTDLPSKKLSEHEINQLLDEYENQLDNLI
ncbi:hypothetical protein [Maledivibacter halophilus]|uniref:Uncharacterized protein n=1 Tax=Maledivibacter halophilus TaxID=36842 RepID=A0A1T5LDL5_9FIRM|nr:hypothetical protein [Maledivibacter halophilus]SKC73954.1 hypothetical protein SAMN02194393_02791 [Maledivibacter halophilus]